MKVNETSRISIVVLSVLLSVFVFMNRCTRKTDLEVGVSALDKGEYVKAVEFFKKALAKDTLDPEVHYHICRAYTYLDSTDRALGHYLKLVDLGSDRKNDRELRQLMAIMVGLEPYPSSIVPMRRLNQFKAAFGPHGDLIAVAAAKTDKADIYLGTLDATNMKKVITGGMNTDPHFSMDGAFLVYVSNRDGDEDLYLHSIDGEEEKKLTDNTAQDFAPGFAPEGKEVVFVSNLDNPYKWEIYAIDVESGRTRRLTNNDYWDGFPRFTANGRSIVFSSKRDGSEDIYVMRRDGGAQEVLFASPADDNDPTLVREDLFFKSQMDGEWEIYRYNLKTKSLVRLTNNQWPDWNPQVSSDGTKLLVSRKIKGRWVLYFINMENPVEADFIAAKIRNRFSK